MKKHEYKEKKEHDVMMSKEEIELFDKNINYIVRLCYAGLFLTFVLWFFE